MSWLRRNRANLPLDDLIDLSQSDHIEIEDQVALNWEIDRTRDILDQLSPKHRAVIELAFMHNLSYADIAEVLDCPIGTVKSRISYALQFLNGILTRLDHRTEEV